MAALAAILDLNISFFKSINHQDTSYRVSRQLVFCPEVEIQTDFQYGGRSSHPGFLIEKISAVFDLQVGLILPTKF